MGSGGEEVEDSALIIKLKELDDEYLAEYRQFQWKSHLLQCTRSEKQMALAKRRGEILKAQPEGEPEPPSKTGTPACDCFWAQALENVLKFNEEIDVVEEWDKAALKFLRDITVEREESKEDV